MDARLNQLAKIDDFKKAYILGQYPHEDKFRAASYEEFYNWMNLRLELSGIELGPVQGGQTEQTATVIPNGPAGQQRKMDASPGWYSVGGQTVEAEKGKVWKWFWNGASWALVEMGELPEVHGVDYLNPLGELIPKERAVASFAPSKISLGITDIINHQNVGDILMLSKLYDNDEFEAGYLRSNNTISSSDLWRTTKKYSVILPGEYITNHVLQGNAVMLIYDKDFTPIQTFSNIGSYNGGNVSNLNILEGAKYYRTSRSTSEASAIDFYINSVGDKKSVTDVTFITPNGLDNKLKEKGFIEISKGVNLLSDLTVSGLDDDTLWGIGFLHSNGTINPSDNYRYSLKRYRIYPGRYRVQAYFGGNARLWILDKAGNTINLIQNPGGSNNFSQDITFTSAEYYLQICHNTAGTSTSWIMCKALDDIKYFEGASSVNIVSRVTTTDHQNAVNGSGISRGILSSFSSNVKKRDKFPVVTFVSDDLHSANFDWYIPMLNDKGVKGTFAFITGRAGVNPDYATDAQVKQLFGDGHDIASHTVTHRHTADLTIQEQEDELKLSKIKIMELIGDNCPIFVPPFGSQSIVTERIVRKYYDLSIITAADNRVPAGTCCNTPPVDTYRMLRVSFDAVNNPYETRLQICKDAVDVAVTNSEWLVFAVHPQNPEYFSQPGWETRRQDLSDLIDYIKSLNVPIMTAKNAHALWKNPVELGTRRLESNYYLVGMNGVSEGEYFE